MMQGGKRLYACPLDDVNIGSDRVVFFAETHLFDTFKIKIADDSHAEKWKYPHDK
jgi:hypothetical protein